MTTKLFTLYLERDNDIKVDDEVIARHVPIAEVMRIAIEHSGEWIMTLFHDDFDGFRIFRLRRYVKATFLDDPNMIVAAVPQTHDFLADKAAAEEIVGAHFLGCQHMYWDGAIKSDQDYAAREKYITERREVRRIDMEIATKLIDALIFGGYTITGDLLDDDREFDHATDAASILAHLFNVEMAELYVHKADTTAWLRFIFDESGWDLIQDYSETLSPLVDSIVEPYLPRNQPSADEYHGIRMLVLSSPDDVLKIEQMLTNL